MLDGYRVQVPIEVRFRDTDMLGHVNNAVYLTYFETGRMVYWRELSGTEHRGHVPFILARAETDFVAEARPGESLVLGIRASRLGGKSFDFEYELVRPADGTVVARGRSVQVMFDYETGRSVALDDELRGRLEEFEGRALAGGTAA